MNKRFQLSYYLRIALNAVVYTIFFAYIIYSAATAGDGGGRLAYVAVGVFFGGGALLYEYLRFCFDEATRQLVFAGNPKKALALSRRVKKADLLKTFDTSLDIMRMLAYVDLRAYEELEAYIASLPYEKLHNYDVAIVARHSQMILYGERKDMEKLENAYKTLSGLEGTSDEGGVFLQLGCDGGHVPVLPRQWHRGMEPHRESRDAEPEQTGAHALRPDVCQGGV